MRDSNCTAPICKTYVDSVSHTTRLRCTEIGVDYYALYSTLYTIQCIHPFSVLTTQCAYYLDLHFDVTFDGECDGDGPGS